MAVDITRSTQQIQISNTDYQTKHNNLRIVSVCEREKLQKGIAHPYGSEIMHVIINKTI